MVVFKYELKQIKKLIIAWSLVMAVLVFLLVPVYMDIGKSVGSDSQQLEQVISDNQFLQAVDMSAEFLSKPIGMYGFLNGWFFALAASVLAMHVGLSVNTKDFAGKSADFIYTKPLDRGKVFLAKLFAASVGVFTVGIVYFVSSYGALRINLPEGFEMWMFLHIAFSLIMLQAIYLALGILVGVIWPRNRRPLLLSVTVVFITVVIGTFAATMGFDWLLFLSPPKFFGGSIIASLGGYDMRFVYWLFFLVIAFISSGYFIFRKKDLITV
ncbi:ABC transporter permease subunit [Gudongella sp. SC589]|jgi:ABC-2 type transport system permease protein|uniref:ABC transporter permease subunit n=1 Tax=Gudongella sp. SC589 TaxID=3385990 RepID=UPI0039048ED3